MGSTVMETKANNKKGPVKKGLLKHGLYCGIVTFPDLMTLYDWTTCGGLEASPQINLDNYRALIIVFLLIDTK